MKKRAIRLAGIYAVLILIGIVYLQFSKISGLGVDCMFYRITNLYCSGCGLTRMCRALVEFKFYQAFRCNPGAAVISPFLLYYFVKGSIYYIKGKSYSISKIESKAWIVLAVLFAIYGILRNISIFSFLAPVTV